MRKRTIPRLAVVTRTKNRTLLLSRAIKSLEAQTSQNFTHVILNDGGDKSDIEKLLRKLPREARVIIHNKESVGLVKALNQVIAHADAEYIAILDDDDSWAPDRVELVLDYFAKNPQAKAVAVRTDIVKEHIENDTVVKDSQEIHPESGDGEINLFKQCIRNYLSNGLITYRRDVYDELGGYDEALETAEDWDFGVRLLSRYDVDLLKTNHALTFYHQRPDITEGAAGNSVIAGSLTQEETINKIRNKYLRDDFTKGKFGVGSIMNISEFIQGQTVRLEGHVNRAKSELVQEVHDARRRLIREHLHQRLLRTLKRRG